MSKRFNSVRTVFCVLAMFVAIGMTLGLVGCGNNDEEQVKADVTEILEAYKSPTEENLKPYIEASGVDMSSFDESGANVYEFADSVFSKFSYTIDEVKAKGDTAVVTLTIKNADLQAAMDAALENAQATIGENQEGMVGESVEKDLMGIVYKEFYEQLEKEDAAMTEETVELIYHKKDDAWAVDEDSVDTLVEAMFGEFSV